VTQIGEVIADLDVTPAEMGNEVDDQVGHGNNIPNRATSEILPPV
jgi:hypothetical protein